MDQRLCGLYGRVSTDRQARVEEGGLDTQVSLMGKFVAFQTESDESADWVHADTYLDPGYSGSNLERPQFRRMSGDIEAGRINTVVVYKIDRITRSLRDFYDLWEFFEKHGVHFVSLHEKFDTTTAIGRAMLKLILVFAELEREQVSERTSATMRHRAEQGLWNGGRRIGYRIDPNEKGVLKVDAEWAPIVREHMFTSCDSLGSAGKVVKHLREIGIRVPEYESRRGNKVGGGYFTKPNVIRILTDPVYIGMIEHKGDLFAGRHEAIIERTLFDRVQEILDRNREKKSNFREQRTHTYILQGLIRCGKCGSMMSPKWSTGRGGKPYHYYECCKSARSVNTECDAKYVPAEAAEAYVLQELAKWAMDPAEIRHVVQEANATKDGRLDRIDRDRVRLRKRLDEVTPQIRSLVDVLAQGGSFASVKERLAELEKDRAAIEAELERLDFERDQVIQHSLSVEVMAQSYRDFPAMLERLKEAEDWAAIKDLVACYVEVLDWHQDPNDPTTGRVDIMLFEPASPLPVGANENPDAVYGNGASGCNGRLPR